MLTDKNRQATTAWKPLWILVESQTGTTRIASPATITIGKQLRDQLYAAVMTLPDKQAKRIYARFYLGMTPIEIVKAEKVDVSRVRDSIRRGLKNLSKLFR